MRPISSLTTAVIIVAWQDIPGIDECLGSLVNQTNQAFRVVVADNGAGLEKRVAPWAERLDLQLLDLGENRGVSEARNRAANLTEAELLLFLDDDAAADSAWVETFQQLMAAQPELAAARGRVRGKSPTILNRLARAYDLGETQVPAIINTEGNCAVRRSDFDAVGGFDSSMFGHEGAELTARLIEHRSGRETAVVYEPKALIHHDYVDTVGQYLTKRYRHGKMASHLSLATVRSSAARSRRSMPWDVERFALAPLRGLGLAAEGVGALRGHLLG